MEEELEVRVDKEVSGTFGLKVTVALTELIPEGERMLITFSPATLDLIVAVETPKVFVGAGWVMVSADPPLEEREGLTPEIRFPKLSLKVMVIVETLSLSAMMPELGFVDNVELVLDGSGRTRMDEELAVILGETKSVTLML